jgi:hypothetical protein
MKNIKEKINSIHNNYIINSNKHIWEGWTVQDFINELEDLVQIAVVGKGYFKTIQTKQQLKEFCMNNQPYYKRYIPEVVKYFANKYNIK